MLKYKRWKLFFLATFGSSFWFTLGSCFRFTHLFLLGFFWLRLVHFLVHVSFKEERSCKSCRRDTNWWLSWWFRCFLWVEGGLGDFACRQQRVFKVLLSWRVLFVWFCCSRKRRLNGFIFVGEMRRDGVATKRMPRQMFAHFLASQFSSLLLFFNANLLF